VSSVASIRRAQLDLKASGTTPRYVFSQDLVTLSEPLSASAEAIRALRTHVLAQHIHAGRRALAICGPSEGVGCTFVAANLAVALAQVGINTLLVDGDLRNPAMGELFRRQDSETDAAASRGLSGCLASPGSRVGDFLEVDVLPNMSLLRAGPPTGNAAELLATEWFERVMNFCLRDHDITIFDTPPANLYADARRISTVAGYSLIVARRNRSLVADVRALANQITSDHGAVIGTVMNA